MALGAIVATALNTHADRTAGLYINGLDVIAQPGGGIGVPLDSIQINTAGPGGVSSMSFRIDDPGLGVFIIPGAEVRFEVYGFTGAAATPFFRGFIDTFTAMDDFGDIGRSFQVRASGAEILLDWLIVGSGGVTVTAGTKAGDAVQTIYSRCIPIGVQLQAMQAGPGLTGAMGSADATIDSIANALVYDVVISPGTTLRAALNQLAAASPRPLQVTVNFRLGLTAYYLAPQDAVTNTITNDSPSLAQQPAEPLEWTTDPATIRTVLVIGSGVTLAVNDGSGVVAGTAVLNDSTLTTAGAANAAGLAVLALYVTSHRGQLTLEDVSTSLNPYSIGDTVSITDTRLGLSAQAEYVTAIERTYTGNGRQSIVVSFGSLPPSMVRLIRNYTRGTVN